jgi:hypothetical protein
MTGKSEVVEYFYWIVLQTAYKIKIISKLPLINKAVKR